MKNAQVNNRKGELLLPKILDKIKQPNSVTYAKYEFSLTQQRVLLTVLKELQEAMEAHNFGNKIPLSQLTLFSESKDNVRFLIPMKDLCQNKSYYKETIEAIEKIANLPFRFAAKNPFTGEDTWRLGGLFTAYVPQKYDRSIAIEMHKDVAKHIVTLLPGGYTSFSYQIAMSASNKYIIRIYQLISRWKDKGSYRMEIGDFRELLNLGDKYKTYSDLKKRILDPAYEELFQKGDCWFELGPEERKNKIVTHIIFKIIKTEDSIQLQKVKDNNYSMLKMHFGLTEVHLDKMAPVLNNINNAFRVRDKIAELGQFVSKDHDKPIGNLQAYVVTSIINEFKK